MSGYMVTVESQDHRSFSRVSTDKPAWACGEVDRVTGLDNAQALAPLADETLDHFDVRSNQPWLCLTTNRWTGEVGSSRLG